jgi:membrane protease subunit HflC
MKISKLAIVGIIAVVAALLASASMFTVRQTEQAIVVQFGNPREVIRQPGLHFKIPFIQQVLTYDSRILSLNPRGQEVPLIDQKRIIVDSFAYSRALRQALL